MQRLALFTDCSRLEQMASLHARRTGSLPYFACRGVVGAAAQRLPVRLRALVCLRGLSSVTISDCRATPPTYRVQHCVNDAVIKLEFQLPRFIANGCVGGVALRQRLQSDRP